MRDENAFNSHVAKKIKAMEAPGPGFTFYMKAADKFRSGVADFLIWRSRQTLAMENKYVAEWPNPNALLLKHEFGGAQLTFLESMAMSGNKAFGLVGVNDGMYLVHWMQIPESGNWKTKDFQGAGFPWWPLAQVPQMIEHIFLTEFGK